MNKLIKVDRVRSVAEAQAVEDLGAGMVGVSVDPDPRFADERVVSLELATEIGRSLRRARLVAEVDVRDDAVQAVRTVRTVGAHYVQPIAGALLPPEVSTVALGVIYSGIEIAHDDDPSWVFSRYADAGDALFQVDLLPEYRNAWEVLRDEAPAYPDDEFQIDDVNALARGRELFVSLNFSPRNVSEIVSSLSGVRGIALTLADHTTRADLHSVRFDDAVAVLTAARSA